MRTIIALVAFLAPASSAYAQGSYRYGNEIPQQNYGNVAPQQNYGNAITQQNYGNSPRSTNYINPQAGYATPNYGYSPGFQQQYGSVQDSGNLTPQQQIQAAEILRDVKIQPLQGSPRASVGQTLTTSTTQSVTCPPSVAGLITGIPNCRVLQAGGQYYIIEGDTSRVRAIINR